MSAGLLGHHRSENRLVKNMNLSLDLVCVSPSAHGGVKCSRPSVSSSFPRCVSQDSHSPRGDNECTRGRNVSPTRPTQVGSDYVGTHTGLFMNSRTLFLPTNFFWTCHVDIRRSSVWRPRIPSKMDLATGRA